MLPNLLIRFNQGNTKLRLVVPNDKGMDIINSINGLVLAEDFKERLYKLAKNIK